MASAGPLNATASPRNPFPLLNPYKRDMVCDWKLFKYGSRHFCLLTQHITGRSMDADADADADTMEAAIQRAVAA
jgi:hypothetical protein